MVTICQQRLRTLDRRPIIQLYTVSSGSQIDPDPPGLTDPRRVTMTLVASGFGPLVCRREWPAFTLVDGADLHLQALNRDPASQMTSRSSPATGSSSPRSTPTSTVWNSNAVQTFTGGVLPISPFLERDAEPVHRPVVRARPDRHADGRPRWRVAVDARPCRPRPGSRRRPPRGAAAGSGNSHSRRRRSDGPAGRLGLLDGREPGRGRRCLDRGQLDEQRHRDDHQRRAAAPWTSARCRPP